MLAVIRCKNPECHNILKTRWGKTGLCKTCAVAANGYKQGKHQWTPEEKALIHKINSNRLENKAMLRTLYTRHTYNSVKTMARRSGMAWRRM